MHWYNYTPTDMRGVEVILVTANRSRLGNAQQAIDLELKKNAESVNAGNAIIVNWFTRTFAVK